MGVNGEALQLRAVYKKLCFFATSHVRIHISTESHVKTRISTTNHVRICTRYCKSCVLHLNMQ